MLLCPDTLGRGRPLVSVGAAAAEYIIGGFRLLHIGAVRTAALDHLTQQLRVFKHRAGAQVVVVEGLALVVFLEQGLLQALEQALVMDIGVGVVDKDAGLHIAGRVDMGILAAAGNAAVNVLAVILEVDAEDRLAAGKAADLTDAVDHVLALLGVEHQIDIGTVTDGHVMEVPVEANTMADEHIHELIACDSLIVSAGVADGGAEQQTVLLHQVHGVHDAVIDALAAAVIGGIADALDRDEEGHVAHFLDTVAEGLVDQGAVSEQMEHRTLVLGSQLEQILLAAGRLTAGAHVPVDAQRLALGDDAVHILKAEVQAVAVLGSPAALAVQVAGRGRVEQQNPRHIAVVLLAQLHDIVVTGKHALIHKVQGVHLQDMGVDLVDCPVGVPHPLAVGVGHKGADLIPVSIGVTVCQQRLSQIDELDGLLGHIFRAFAAHCLDGRVKGGAERCTLGGMDYFIHRHS